MRTITEFQYVYHSWKAASKDVVEEYAHCGYAAYESSSEVRYYRSKMLELLALMRSIGVEAEENGKSEGQVLYEPQRFQKQIAELEYQRACPCFILQVNFLALCHFLVLPADLRSWKQLGSTYTPLSTLLPLPFPSGRKGTIQFASAHTPFEPPSIQPKMATIVLSSVR